MDHQEALSQIKKSLIQLRPVEKVCSLVVDFLNEQLSSTKTGIFIWDEKTASFQIWPVNIIKLTSLRVFDPFLLHITEYDKLYFRADIDDQEFYRKFPAEASDARRIFKESNARLLVPLVLNQSLIGLIFITDATSELKADENQKLIMETASLAVMALSNSILYNRLEGILANLEEKVQERTSELRQAQTQLVQKEKMAMLGVMVAGIAHEVNTPASVIQGSSENISKNLYTIIKNLKSVQNIIPETKFHSFMLSVKSIGLKVSSQKKSGIVNESFKRKRELSDYFKIQNIALHKNWAALFVESSLYGTKDSSNIESFANSSMVKSLIRTLNDLDEDHERIILEFFKEITNTARNLKNIHYSIKNIIRIVRALKHYSHLDEGEMGYNNLNLGLENTLIILGSVIKGEITIEENFGNIPDVICNPDELSQVWTNLITNSAQALKNSTDAKITITTFAEPQNEPDRVIVEVKDNGPGIPPQIQSKIWDPFFTTKDQGEGSGLGLGIVLGIIEKHKAKIELKKSDSNGTIFQVIFDLKQPGN